MSFTPGPPTDEELEALKALSDRRWRLARMLHYPCFVVLAGAQVVRSRWDEWRAR
jgi:hypothetical protein